MERRKLKMVNSLAPRTQSITLLWPTLADKLKTGVSMTRLRTRTGGRTTRRGKGAWTAPTDAPPLKTAIETQDPFYRDLVWSLRNGVLAIKRDGRVAVINDEAYRILGLTARATDLGRPYADVLGPCQDVAQILRTAFELSHLPNRAELRLKTTGKVIGYTLSLIQKNDGEDPTGAALFFKDLTRVEQLEERERLRDRLAALGEMAAAIAHEVKNPLAGIQVLSGILKRQLPDSPDAQGILQEIISEAKMANAIVLDVLEFVRPADPPPGGAGVAERRATRGPDDRRHPGGAERHRDIDGCGRRLAPHPGRSGPASAAVHELADQRVRGPVREG